MQYDSVQATPEADVQIRVAALPRNLCIVRGAVEAAARRAGMSECDADQIVLAVDEALTNVIRHGYRNCEQGPITLKITFIQQQGLPGLRFVIEDECEGVNLSAIKSRDLDDVRPGGLGVHIIHSVMDHVSYAHRPNGKGVQLTMHRLSKSRDTPCCADHAPCEMAPASVGSNATGAVAD